MVTTTAVPAPAIAGRLSRLVAPAATLVGTLDAVLAVVQLLAPAQPTGSHHFVRASDYVVEVLFAVSLFATAGAIILLGRYHRGLGRWGTFGAVAAGGYALGTALFGVSSAATAARGVETLDPVQLPAIAMWLVAGLLMAVATFRAGILPIAVCIGFAVALPASMALGNAGPFAMAVLWLAVAVVAARNRPRTSYPATAAN